MGELKKIRERERASELAQGERDGKRAVLVVGGWRGGGGAGGTERRAGKVEKDGRRPTGPFKVPRRQQKASNELIKLSNSFGLASERANKCSPLPRGPLQRARAPARPERERESYEPNLCTLLAALRREMLGSMFGCVKKKTEKQGKSIASFRRLSSRVREDSRARATNEFQPEKRFCMSDARSKLIAFYDRRNAGSERSSSIGWP